jgi:hypothetical protein
MAVIDKGLYSQRFRVSLERIRMGERRGGVGGTADGA